MNDKTLITIAMRKLGQRAAKKRRERMGEEIYKKFMGNLGSWKRKKVINTPH